MARIRTIKPEYWQDEKLAKCDPLTRLVFLGLISQADDAGRLVDSVKMLDGLLFSFTDDTCATSLVVLARLGVIERGTTESGQRIIQIVKWTHQKIDKPNLSAALPTIAVKTEIPVVSQPFVETSPKDRGNVGEASTPHISTNDQLSGSTTTDALPIGKDETSELKPDPDIHPIAPKLEVTPAFVVNPNNIGATFTAAWIRENLWKGDTPPSWVLREKPNWGEADEIAAIKQLHKHAGYTYEDMFYGLPRLARVASLPANSPMSMYGVVKKDKRYNVGVAIESWRKEHMEATSTLSIGEIMRRGA